MFWGQLLMTGSKRQPLSALHETMQAFRVGFGIHFALLIGDRSSLAPLRGNQLPPSNGADP
jgi:hypothetical protein